MKKTLLTLIGLLALIYVVLTVVDTKSEYILEKAVAGAKGFCRDLAGSQGGTG